MPLNADVSFTWVGHGTWKVRSARRKDILIDPWVMNNPVAPDKLKTVDRCDLMLITHGHFDHVHDALEIARATTPKIVTIHEIGAWLTAKGISAIMRARFTDTAISRWCLAQLPLNRRGTSFPRSVMKYFSSEASL